MFEKTLVKGAKSALESLGRSGLLSDAYLAGGTAAALQMGHRVSVDFDFFTPREFVPGIFAGRLSQTGLFEKEQADKGTVLGKFEKIKFSLFVYHYPLLFPAVKYLSSAIADIRDIAAMKIDAITSRGAKRDFIDLYFICQTGYSLKVLLDFYNRKYKTLASNFIHIEKSLVFFDDAEPEPMPKMLKKANWQEIKRYFQAEVKKLIK
jgi:Nucleotidyl transferase AbiEii toxin, Type IV TA system